MTELPSIYGPLDRAVRLSAKEPAAIANLLEFPADRMPSVGDYTVLTFLNGQAMESLDRLRAVADRCNKQNL